MWYVYFVIFFIFILLFVLALWQCGGVIFECSMASISLLLYTVYSLRLFCNALSMLWEACLYMMLDKLRRCPACWLAHILNLIKTRRCLVSRTPILADLPHVYCSGYIQALLCLYNQDMHLYHNCGGLFPSHAGIIYCFFCRDWRRTILQMPVIFTFSSTAVLNLFC